MRAIDADALQLAIVEEGQANKRKKYIIGDIWELTGAEIREVINSQPTIQPEPQWIPVTERLPESKEEDLEYPTVLIAFENEEIMLGCFYESTKEWGTGEYFDKKCDPIAWMPLPEPYKGVTE